MIFCGCSKRFIRYGRSSVDKVRTAVVVRGVGSSIVTVYWWCVTGFGAFCSTIDPCVLYQFRGVCSQF